MTWKEEAKRRCVEACEGSESGGWMKGDHQWRAERPRRAVKWRVE